MIKRLFSSQGLNQSLLVMGGNVVAQGMSAIALIIISRNLGPLLFGEFMVGFALVILLSKINDLGLTYAQQKFIPNMTDRKDQNQLFSAIIQLKLIVTSIIVVLGTLSVPLLSQLLGFSNQHILYLAVWLSLATAGFEQISAMLQALLRFPQAVIANVLQGGMKLAGILLLWISTISSAANYFLIYMLSPITPVLIGKALIGPGRKLNLSKNYVADWQKIGRMTKHSAIAFIAAGVIENIDILMVQGYLQEYEAGLYGGVSRIALLIAMFAFSLATVLNPRVARYKEKKHLDAYLKKVVYVTIFSLAGLFILWPFSHMLIKLTIGAEYGMGARALQLLLAASFTLIITVTLIAPFFSFPRAEWYFSSAGIIQLVSLISFNIILLPGFGLLGAAWARLLSRLILLGYTGVILLLVYRRTYKPPSESAIKSQN